MAISTATFSASVGWARTDIILQLENALTFAGYHAPTATGIVTGISTYSGGGTVVGSNATYPDVFQTSSSGIGTGASFYITRSSGTISAIRINRPGIGYTNGEVVSIASSSIGNSGVGLTITTIVAGGASPIGFGSTNSFYKKDITSGSSFPWGTLRQQVQSGKRFGDTYRVFQVASSTQIDFHVGSGFMPTDVTNTANMGGTFNRNRFVGVGYLDYPENTTLNNFSSYSSSVRNNVEVQTTLTYANSTNVYQLDLNVYKSGVDPNFSVFCYKQPTLSSTTIFNNNSSAFILHNYITSIWDYDYLFLGGITIVAGNNDANAPGIFFDHHYGEKSATFRAQKRSAEFGYYAFSTDGDSVNGANSFKRTAYYSNALPTSNNTEFTMLYYRNNTTTRGTGNGGEILPNITNINSIIKGIPINATFVPVPYYIPDDFVLINFDYSSPSANIQQGDTITVSPSEVYVIIQASYNQTTRTRGIAFCGRIV